MRLTPSDITHQEFSRALRGFRAEEVAAFLEVVAENYAELDQENKSLQQQLAQSVMQIERLKQQIATHEKTIRECKNDLMKVDRLMDSKVDAEMTLQKAQAEAEKIIHEATQKATQIENDLRYLKEQKAKTAAQLREYLLSQLAVLEIIDEKSAEIHQTAETRAPQEIMQEPLLKKPSQKTEEIDLSQIEFTKKPETPAQESIQEFLSGIRMDDIPQELAEAIESLSQSKNAAGDGMDEKKKKVLEDLEKLNRNATSMFRKADLKAMLGEDASKKAEDLINEIHSELEKKKNKPE